LKKTGEEETCAVKEGGDLTSMILALWRKKFYVRDRERGRGGELSGQERCKISDPRRAIGAMARKRGMQVPSKKPAPTILGSKLTGGKWGGPCN